MKITKYLTSSLLVFSLVAADAYAAYPAANHPAIGTGRQGVTGEGRNSDSAMAIAQRLRAKIMADNQLSTEAHNVQIIAQPTSITLKGDVANRAEKVKLENYARAMAGNKRVYNQLKY